MKDNKLVALAAKAKKGDKEAFEKLYSEHVRSILFHVRSLIVDKESCYDVAQEAVLQMFTHIHQLREPAAFRGWMHQIVRTTCAEHNRKYLSAMQKVGTSEEAEQLDEIEDDDIHLDPEAVTMANLEGKHLFAIVNELPEQYREILAQRYYDDLSYKEISEVLGISMSNVGMRLQRATEALRKKIGEAGEGQFAQNKGTVMKDETTQGHNILSQEDASPEIMASSSETSGVKPIDPSDEEALKNSFASGVSMLFPKEPVDEFLNTTNEKILEIAGAAGTTGGTAATTSSFWGVLAGVGGTIVVVAIFAIGVITLGPSANNEQADENVPVVQEEPQLHEYSGTMHLEFVDADGNDSDRNVVSATLVEDEAAAQSIRWDIYPPSGGPAMQEEGAVDRSSALFSGNTYEIGSDVFAALEQGEYLLVFTLVDENNATAVVKRNFVIA